MRISGGRARGVKLTVDRKAVHRPAMDRLRQGVFSSLGARIEGARVCDLFAGTGSYGLEALSRGASLATFVEQNRRAVAMIKNNVAIVEKSMRIRLDARIIAADVTRWAPDGSQFDLIFVDPPYESIGAAAPRLFALLGRILADDGLVVFELPGQIELSPPSWALRKRIGKGANQPTACLYEKDPPDPSPAPVTPEREDLHL